MGREGFVVPPETQGSLPKKAGGSSSWILINYSGESTILDLNKYAILRRAMIHARDLRVLDPLLSYPSTILGRERAIVLNLEHIKAIITEEEALLRDPMDCNVVPVAEELQRRLQPLNAICDDQGEGANTVFLNENNGSEENEFPFEFRALEVAVEAVCTFLDARTMELENDAYPALDELTSKISSCNLDRVRKIKSSMTRLTNRVQKVRDELEQLLDNDGDMAELCLSRKKAWSSSPGDASCEVCWLQNSPTVRSKLSRGSRASAITFLGENDVEELEMLLEAYFMQIDGTLNKLATLREYVNDTEDYINIQLDSHRNQLIQLQLFLSSGTTCLSVCSLVLAIFGMNIPYTWKEGHGYIFKWVVIFTGIASTSLFMSIMLYARHKGLIGI